MADTVDDRARDIARIAEQNDAFRCKRPGGGQGQWVYTQAVRAEGQGFVLACVAAVAAYDDFNEDIDPYGTHEMGTMEVMSCLLYTSPSPRDQRGSRMPSSA